MYNSILLLNSILLGNEGNKEDFKKIQEINEIIMENNKHLEKNQERLKSGKTSNKYLANFIIEDEDERQIRLTSYMQDYVQEGVNEGTCKKMVDKVQVVDEEKGEFVESNLQHEDIEVFYVAMMHLILSENGGDDRSYKNLEQILQSTINAYNGASLVKYSDMKLSEWARLYQENPNQFLSEEIDKEDVESIVLHNVFQKTFGYCKMGNLDDNSMLNGLYLGIADTVANKYSRNLILSKVYGASDYVKILENGMAYMLEKEREAVREFYTIEKDDVKSAVQRNSLNDRSGAQTYLDNITREQQHEK